MEVLNVVRGVFRLVISIMAVKPGYYSLWVKDTRLFIVKRYGSDPYGSDPPVTSTE